jgi:hypothetical protein
MNRITNALREVVRSDRHLTVQPNGCVVLREHDAAAALTQVNVNCRGCNHLFAFTLDVRAGGRAIALSEHTSKASTSRWNKVCDGIFVWHDATASCWRVLVCDLKSATPHGSDWKEQLWSSACFVDYLFSILRRFHPNVPSPEPLRFHAVAFHRGAGVSGRQQRTTAVRPGIGYPTTNLLNPGKLRVSEPFYVHLQALCK